MKKTIVMKRFILLSAGLLCFTFLSFSQKAPFITFNKTFELCDTCVDLVQQEIGGAVETNGGLIVYGNVYAGYTTLGMIYKTDLNFDTIYWKQTLGSDTNYYTLNRMLGLQNKNEYLVAGTHRWSDSIDYYYQSFLMKTDSSGNIIWRKQYGLDEDPDYKSSLRDVVLSYDKGYLLAATSNNGQSIIIKVDSLGNKQWQAIIEQPGYYTDLISCVETPDSGFLVGGRVSDGIFSGEALVYKYSKDGDYEWVRSFGGPYVDGMVELAMSNEPGVFFGSYVYTTRVHGWGYFDAGELRLFKLNSEGNVLFEKAIGDTNLVMIPESVHQLENNNVLIVGSRGYIHTGWMYFISPEGDSVKFEPFEAYGDSSDNCVFINGSKINGGVLVSGYADKDDGFTTTERRGWVVKTDMYGCMNNISILSQPYDVIAKLHNTTNLEINAYSVDSISYQWYKDTTMIEGATDSILTIENFLPPDEGFYFCYLTNSCETIKSDTIKVFTHLGLDEYDADKLFSVYPNPGTDYVVIKSGAAFTGKVEVSIITLNGKVLKKTISSNFNKGQKVSIDLSNIAAGVYIIQVKNNQMTGNSLLVKEE